MNLRKASTAELLAFTATLSTRDWRKMTEQDIKAIDVFISSDGCSGVPDFYRECCVIHDWWYRTHRNFDGTPITKAQADRGLEQCDQQHSILGKASLIARLWYWGVRKFGRKAWM